MMSLYEKGISMKSVFIACVTAALALPIVTPVHAKDVVEHSMSNDDVQKVDMLVDTFVDRLVTGKYDTAVKEFLGTSELMSGKTAELAQLVSQIKSAAEIYGPISKCVLVAKKGRGGIFEEHMYLCQHARLLTRWKLAFAKTSGGWVATNLYFDDKVADED
jgi:hypothetical protein